MQIQLQQTKHQHIHNSRKVSANIAEVKYKVARHFVHHAAMHRLLCLSNKGHSPYHNNLNSSIIHQMQQPAYMTGAYQQPPQAAVTSSTQNGSTTVIVQSENSNGMGTAGFVLALLSLLVCWVPVVDIIVWFLGALFSFIGLFKAPRGLAIAGFVISFIGIVVLVIFFGVLIGIAEK